MASRPRRSPRNRNDIADFVGQRVREAMDETRDRPGVNTARVDNARTRTRTTVSGPQYVEVIERLDRRRPATKR